MFRLIINGGTDVIASNLWPDVAAAVEPLVVSALKDYRKIFEANKLPHHWVGSVLDAKENTHSLNFNAAGGGFTIVCPGIFTVASWTQQKLPGCCGISIVTGASVYSPFTKHGIGTILHQMRIDYARKTKTGLMICTDKNLKKDTDAILRKFKWERTHVFRSPNTGNTLRVDILPLVDMIEDNVVAPKSK